jgi:hypothetical protein
MIQLAEWVFWIPDSLRDDFHHSFHNNSCRAALNSAFNLPCWLTANCLRSEYKTNCRVCHSNFSKIFSGETKRTRTPFVFSFSGGQF